MTRTIIAGGGIVGLTAGRALLRAGMEVIVAEKADAIRAAGATLGLWANAVRVFDDLDVDVRSVGREAQMYFHGTSGQLLRRQSSARRIIATCWRTAPALTTSWPSRSAMTTSGSRQLSDRAEIGDIVARLGYTQDDKDFDGLAALFTDRIGFDMSAAGGGPAADVTRDELVSLAARFSRVSLPPGTAPVTC